MFAGGLSWITRRAKAAMAKGEGYGEHEEQQADTADASQLPSVMAAIWVGVSWTATAFAARWCWLTRHSTC